MDYSKRSTAEQTLVHPYLSYYHDPTDEPAFQGSVASSKFLEVYSGSELEISRWKGSTESFELYFFKLSIQRSSWHAIHAALYSSRENSM